MMNQVWKRIYRSLFVGLVVSLLIVKAFEITIPLITRYITWSKHFFPGLIAAWTPGIYRAYTTWHHSVALDDLLEVVAPIVLGALLCVIIGLLIEEAIASPFQRAFKRLSRLFPILRPLASVVEQGIKRLGINQEGDVISPTEICVWMDGTTPIPCFFNGFTEPFDLVGAKQSRLASINVPGSPNWFTGSPKLVDGANVVRLSEVLVNGELLTANIDLIVYSVSGGNIVTRTLEILEIISRMHYDRRVNKIPEPGNFTFTFQNEVLQVTITRENDKLPIIIANEQWKFENFRSRL